MRWRRIPSTLCAVALAAASASHAAGSMQPLADADLAAVSGRDGLAFNLKDFSLSGPLALTYTMPGPAGQTLKLANLSLARSDDPAATFSDPYTLRVLSRSNGLADVIRLSEPANVNGLL